MPVDISPRNAFNHDVVLGDIELDAGYLVPDGAIKWRKNPDDILFK